MFNFMGSGVSGVKIYREILIGVTLGYFFSKTSMPHPVMSISLFDDFPSCLSKLIFLLLSRGGFEKYNTGAL